MEEEAFFLFAIFSYHYDGETAETSIKRYTFRKDLSLGGRDRFKRVQVDFDPLQNNIAFGVYFLVDGVERDSRVVDFPRFAYIVNNEEQAKKLKLALESGGYKEFMKEGDVYKSGVTILAGIITNE